MDKQCADITPLIDAYLDGELAPAMRSDVDNHIGACGGCAQHLAATRQLVHSLRSLPRPAVPRGLSEKLDAIAAQPGGAKIVPLARRSWLAAAAAAAVVLAAVATSLTHKPPVTALKPQTAPADTETANQSSSAGGAGTTQQSAVQTPAPVLANREAAPTVVPARKPAAATNVQPLVADKAPRAVPEQEQEAPEQQSASVALAPERLQGGADDEPGFRSIAELPSEKGSFETVGVSTDEDGLYDIRM